MLNFTFQICRGRGFHTLTSMCPRQRNKPLLPIKVAPPSHVVYFRGTLAFSGCANTVVRQPLCTLPMNIMIYACLKRFEIREAYKIRWLRPNFCIVLFFITYVSLFDFLAYANKLTSHFYPF